MRREQQIIRRYGFGETMRSLSRVYRMPMRQINNILTAAGVPRRTQAPRKGAGYAQIRGWGAPPPPRRPWRAEIAERLRELRLSKG